MVAIHIDFVSDHFVPDLRRGLLLGWFLVAPFIRIAENVATWAKIWI